MKQTFLSLLLAFAGVFSALAEDVHVTVHGSAPATVTEVSIYNLNTNQPLGTAQVVNGKFTYSATLDESTFVGIIGKGLPNSCVFVADGATIYANMETGRVMGTRLSNKLDAFDKEMCVYDSTFIKIKDGIATVKDTAKISQLKKIRKGTKKMKNQEIIKFIESNKDNILPAFVLTEYGDDLSMEDKEKYASNTTDAYSKSPMMAGFRELLQIEKAQQAFIGQPVKDFTIKDVSGKASKLSEFTGKGKYTLVDFWASWCGPCMREMPNVKSNYGQYHAQGFNVIGVSLDSKKDAWQNAIKSKGLSWQQFCDFTAWKNEGVALYDIKGIPWNFLCDSKGTIVAVDLRGDKLGDKLEELLDE